jgi:hypothetical protein
MLESVRVNAIENTKPQTHAKPATRSPCIRSCSSGEAGMDFALQPSTDAEGCER